MRSLTIVYVGLAILAPLFALAERLAPEREQPHPFRRERLTDALYWLVVTPLVTGTLTRSATLGLVGVTLLLMGHVDPRDALLSYQRASFVATLHPALQLLLALWVADLVGYFSHRLRHRGVLWRLHAVHHSARVLDWAAAARMHPLDDMIDNALTGTVLLACGFSPEVFLLVGPVLLLHTLLTHANVRWTFGPLRYVFVSPAFHRLHHASDHAGAKGCNYAGMFALHDLVFGTFVSPDEPPAEFGPGERDVPESVLGQLASPFSSARSDDGVDPG